MKISADALVFPAPGQRDRVVQFDGAVTSDAGVALLAQADRRLGVTAALAAACHDPRQAGKVVHPAAEILAARVYAIVLGYEDGNDFDRLRHDPALKTVCGIAEVLRWCEALGLSRNDVLHARSTATQIDACLKHRWAGDGCREFGAFAYAAGTAWATATVTTLRTRVLNIGAKLVETCRKIWWHLPTRSQVRGCCRVSDGRELGEALFRHTLTLFSRSVSSGPTRRYTERMKRHDSPSSGAPQCVDH